MKVSIKSFFAALGLVACIAMTTSCNKGYGCPSDFSVDACVEAPADIVIAC